MATVKQILSIRASLPYALTSLSALAAATYVSNTTAYDCSVNQPLDVIVELVAATTNTPTGNKQLVVFISESLDGTNFRSGPTSGTTAARESNLRFLGTMPIPTATNSERSLFSVIGALGFVPKKFFIIIKNDLGVALTSATVFTAEVSSTII